jgi:exopolysaccharide biosynthesis polyprenyl glycosylphosphotransferase
MGARLRQRRGAVWTVAVVAAAAGVAAWIAGSGWFSGVLLLGAVGLLLVGPTARRAERATQSGSSVESAQQARRRRTIIVGAGPVAQALARALNAAGDREVIGFVEDGTVVGGVEGRLLGSRAELPSLIQAHAADEILLAEAPSWQEDLMQRVMPGAPHLQVAIVPGLYETAIGRMPRHRVRDVPLLSLAPWQRGTLYECARRAADVLFSGVALVITAPLCALAVLAIKLTSPGPVLFRQDRVGLNGHAFTMFKFRTMVLDAERDGPSLCTGYDDERLTPVGRLLRKTRLDEIPQFINVIRGEMSVIGPRPERPVFVEQFEQEIAGYQERHRIRPGITGLAQVNGSYHSNARDKLRYDLFYVYNRSLWLDLGIIVRTFGAMIH